MSIEVTRQYMDVSPLVVVTKDGRFSLDDVVSLVIFLLTSPTKDKVILRNPDSLPECCYFVDFDKIKQEAHEEFEGETDSEVIWKKYGMRVLQRFLKMYLFYLSHSTVSKEISSYDNDLDEIFKDFEKKYIKPVVYNKKNEALYASEYEYVKTSILLLKNTNFEKEDSMFERVLETTVFKFRMWLIGSVSMLGDE